MDLVTRAEWRARRPRSELTALPSARGTKLHYVGSFVSPDLAKSCARCLDTVQGIQAYHQDSNRWTDIAYNLLVCPHGKVWEGRGARVLSAANGPGLNSGHYAVCALLGDRGLVQPTAAMLRGIHDAIGYLRARGAGGQVLGHRDGYSTSCPGPVLYGWLQRGMPLGGQRDDTTPIPRRPAVPRWPGRYLEYRYGKAMLRGQDVAAWQTRCKQLKYTITVDGAYGPTSAATTRVLQRALGVADDGVVGPKTWAAAW
ncbi:peptidoglycan recognition protein family protein [Nonomuraea sp. bgisy101]|uniref:peptidoglycan recognition protein family protein n=1 Tax=Nonomuraea sp. bgisy101 TaxID=3413784 RepID=UPI003D7515D6